MLIITRSATMPKLNNLKSQSITKKTKKAFSTITKKVEPFPITTLVLFSIIIRVFYLSLQNPLWWDSYVYLGMGKFLLSQGASGLFELFRPPLHPLFIGTLWKSGIDPLFAGIIFDVFFSVLVVILTYKIGVHIFSKKNAFLAALLTSITPIFLLHTGLVLTEPLAMTLSVLAVYLFITRRSLFLTGLLLGLSVLAKFPQGILFPLLVLIIIVRKNTQDAQNREKSKNFIITKTREIVPLTLGFFLVLLSYGYWNYLSFGDPLAPIKAGAWIVTTATWLYGSGLSYYFIHFFLTYPLFLFFWIYVYLYIKDTVRQQKINNHNSLLLLLICLATIGYFLTVPRKEPRYLVTIIPYLALLSLEAMRRVHAWLKQKEEKQEKPALYPNSFITICLILGIIFIPGPLSFESTIYPEELKTQLQTQAQTQAFEKGTALPIITSNPLPAEFTDNKIIPLGNMEYAAVVYAENKKTAGLLLLTDCDLLCSPGDITCEKQKKDLIEKISRENSLLFHKTIKGCSTNLFDLQSPKR